MMQTVFGSIAHGTSGKPAIAYAGDAAVFCPFCAVDLYGPHPETVEDSEGNRFMPIFNRLAVAEHPDCDRCWQPL